MSKCPVSPQVVLPLSRQNARAKVHKDPKTTKEKQSQFLFLRDLRVFVIFAQFPFSVFLRILRVSALHLPLPQIFHSPPLPHMIHDNLSSRRASEGGTKILHKRSRSSGCLGSTYKLQRRRGKNASRWGRNRSR